MNSSLEERVRTWIALDPDGTDRATLQSLLDAGDEAELTRRFAAPLTFGTAGLRGPVMAGPAGMNRATVRRATLGVLKWLQEKRLDPLRGVVVGRDARHGSEAFNDEVVAVLLGEGAVVYEMPSPLPTPLVPYCVKALGAVAGVMITASHNPGEDNGYKLYAHDGAQIVPPDDAIIERYANESMVATLAERSVPTHHYVTPESLNAYRAHVTNRFRVAHSELAIVYTPMHGVGGVFMSKLFEDSGFARVTPVAEQFNPDARFPTLPFPNPEEKGALDLAMETARAVDATLIIANDPDADRLGAAVRDGEWWRVLRGDEIGWLLASLLIDEVKATGASMATTIVSSSLLAKMAVDHAIPCVTTLTGFKWVARAAGAGKLGFGYEEALGFAVDSAVADKDGLSAALALCRLAHELGSEGGSLLDRLDEIETSYGVHATSQMALRAEGLEGLSRVHAALERLRVTPPLTLGEINVTQVVDLNEGFRGLPPTEGVWLTLGDLGRVVVRPSGTEPKVKAYVEITPPREDSLERQRRNAADLLDGVVESLVELLRA